MLKKLHPLFLLVFLVSSPLRAQWINAEEAFPDFYQTISNTNGITAEMRDEFFSFWTTKESRLLEIAISKVEKSREEHGNYTTAKNIKKYTGPIYAVFGELEIAAWARYRFKNQPKISIMNAWEIDQIKKIKETQNNIPDGVIYEINDGFVEIINVLESKMGSTLFSRKQAKGYFRSWKNNGIYLFNKKGKIQQFQPNDIKFNIGFKLKRLIPITHMTINEFLEYIVTIHSEKKPQDFGQQLQLSFGTKQAKEITQNHGLKIFEIDNSPNSKKDKDQPNNQLEKIDQKNLSKKIQKWFWSQRNNDNPQWPKTGLHFDDISGKALKSSMEKIGNKAKIFIYHMSLRTKYFLISKNALPHLDLIEQELIHADTKSHGLLETFKIYFSLFEESDGSFSQKARSGKKVKANYERLYIADDGKSCHEHFKLPTN